jgi:predicted ester cyclase
VGAPTEVIRKKIEAFNSQVPEELRPFFSPDAEQRISGSITVNGFDDVMALYRVFWDAFPDFTVSLERVVEQGKIVFVEGRAVGTHTGPLREPSGDIPPTGHRVDFAWADCYVVEDGVIVSSHQYYDSLVLLEQLGLAPAPAHT